MRSLLRPALMARYVWEIDLDSLYERGVRGLILDLDNTLVEWNRAEIRPEVRAWVEAARRRGMRLCLVSNAFRGRRVRAVAEALEIQVVVQAMKPFPRAFRKALAMLGTEAGRTCAIGDQVFTDMLGANWLGLVTALLAPLAARESPHTRAIRLLERPLRRKWQRAVCCGAAKCEESATSTPCSEKR
jgi:HAD superfamily phosphatase (TIGR01668 family)